MPTVKHRNYTLTNALLQQYRDEALSNAEELLAEASLLLQHHHHARAYFLSVASIEETGKAVQAFGGMGRNLNNPAVSNRLKIHFEDHSQKITAAFMPWLLASPNLREEAMGFVNKMIDVKHGREPSMYTDIQQDGPLVTSPKSVVPPHIAENCVHLASAVLSYAKPYATQSTPVVTTRTQDEFFAMKPAVYLKIMNSEDFWEFYIVQMEAGEKALETAVTKYHTNYLSKETKFSPSK